MQEVNPLDADIADILTDSNVYYRLMPGDYTQAGSLGASVALTGTDKIIELTAGAKLGQVLLGNGLQRCMIRGENPRDGSIFDIQRTTGSAVYNDIVLDHITIDDTVTLDTPPSVAQQDVGNLFNGPRVQAYGCYVNGQGYGWYMSGNPGASNIAANCVIIKRGPGPGGAEHAYRGQSLNRAFLIDTWFISRDEGQFRIHNGGSGTTDLVYALRCDIDIASNMQLRGDDQGDGQDLPRLGRIRMENCTFRRDGGSIVTDQGMGYSDQDQPTHLEMINHHYIGGTWPTEFQNGASAPAGSTTWDMSGAQETATYTALDPANFIWKSS